VEKSALILKVGSLNNEKFVKNDPRCDKIEALIVEYTKSGTID